MHPSSYTRIRVGCVLVESVDKRCWWISGLRGRSAPPDKGVLTNSVTASVHRRAEVSLRWLELARPALLLEPTCGLARVDRVVVPALQGVALPVDRRCDAGS